MKREISQGYKLERNRLKSILGYFLKLVFALGIIAYLVYGGNLDFKLLKKIVHPVYLPIILLLPFVGIFINNFRWWILCKTQGFELSMLKCLRWSLIGIFFNYALPSSVGGDVVKGFYLAKDHPQKKWRAASSILMDRVLGLYTMIGIACLSLFFNQELVNENKELKAIFYFVSLLFIGLGVFFFLAFSKRIADHSFINKVLDRFPEKIKKVYIVVNSYGRSKKVILVSLLLSLISQLSVVYFMYLTSHLVSGELISMNAFLFVVPIAFIIMSIPLTPAGLGVGQVAYLNLFQMYLSRKLVSAAVTITVFQLVLFLWGLVGAYFYLQRKNNKEVVND